MQDTDVTPFDTGAYASRQSFVTGTAVKECAQLLKQKILDYARTLVPGNVDRSGVGRWLYPGRWQTGYFPGRVLQWRAITALDNSSVLTAEVSRQVKKEYSCHRLLLCRGGSRSEAW